MLQLLQCYMHTAYELSTDEIRNSSNDMAAVIRLQNKYDTSPLLQKLPPTPDRLDWIAKMVTLSYITGLVSKEFRRMTESNPLTSCYLLRIQSVCTN